MKFDELKEILENDATNTNGKKALQNALKRVQKDIDTNDKRKRAMETLIARSNGNSSKIKRIEDKLEELEGYLDFLYFCEMEIEMKFIIDENDYENIEE